MQHETVTLPDATPPASTAPAPSYAAAPEVVVLSDNSGARAESIRALRTHLIATHIRDGKRGLAICSTDADADGLFVGVNLAVSLAQAGVRTLLIDGDMRTPGVDRMLVPSQEVPALRQYLTDDTLSVGDVIQENVVDNLSVIFSGGHADNAQELLSSARFKRLVDTCLRDHDITIVVTPPTNICADARRVASVIRYAAIVARRDSTYVSDIEALLGELSSAGVKVVGTVMNVF